MVDAHVTSRRMPAMKPVGERSAGNPHAAFDERGGETERLCGTAPLLDSTYAGTCVLTALFVPRLMVQNP